MVGLFYCCEAIFSRSDRSRVLAVLWCAVLCCTACGAPRQSLELCGEIPALAWQNPRQTAATRFCFCRVHGWVPSLQSRRLSQAGPLPFAPAGLPSRFLASLPACLPACPYMHSVEGSDNGPKFQGGVMELARWRRRGWRGKHSQRVGGFPSVTRRPDLSLA